MADNEIVKNLKAAVDWFTNHGSNTNTAVIEISQRAIDVIERQKAEIERLKEDNEYILMQHKFDRRPNGDCWNDVIEKAKSEAIREFAERLSGDLYKLPSGYKAQLRKMIDDLVKEMAGDTNEG